jgi:hypothetical protein
MNNNLLNIFNKSSSDLNAQCCPICLEKIKKWTLWVSRGVETLGSCRFGAARKVMCWINIKKIACGHIFHSKCINMIYKCQCPLCEYPIFNNNEEAILKCNNTLQITNFLKMYFANGEFKNLYFYIIKSISTLSDSSNRRKRYFKILTLAYKHCDFTDILASSLNPNLAVESGMINTSFHSLPKDRARRIKELIQNTRINWHKTFNEKTFFELAIENTNNLATINLILDKLPYNSLNWNRGIEVCSKSEVKRPSAPLFND